MIIEISTSDKDINRVMNTHYGKALRAFIVMNYHGTIKDLGKEIGASGIQMSRLFASQDFNTKWIRMVCEALGLHDRAFHKFLANHKLME